LVYHDNEDWQDELDMVCRKIYKYMKTGKEMGSHLVL